MKITGSTIQQMDKSKPRSRCRDWRLWVSTDCGRKSRMFHGTYSEAKEALSSFVEELESFLENSDKFEKYAKEWRTWREKSGRYSSVTVSEDARKVRALLRTDLSDMRMDEIAPEDCRRALLWLKGNRVYGGEYTNTSMQGFHQTLHSILEQAVDDGKLESNPMTKIKMPKKDTKEKEALSPAELALLMNRLDELMLDGRVVAVYLMASLGLRRGEACALSVDDLSGNICRVKKAMKPSGEIGATKSAAGMRTLPMPDRAVDHIERWMDMRDCMGWRDAELLCLNTQGRPLRPSMLGGWWTSVRDSLGCSGMTLHQLRHSNLSMMARHMSAFDLQRYAGWSSIAPAKIYVHDDLESVMRGASEAWESITRTEYAQTRMS